MDGQTDGQMDGWTERLTEEQTEEVTSALLELQKWLGEDSLEDYILRAKTQDVKCDYYLKPRRGGWRTTPQTRAPQPWLS
jgi:hypothetical protein